ncbi:MAG: hypothetical protein AAGC83_05980, partial [Pseudomonadota bacterium]
SPSSSRCSLSVASADTKLAVLPRNAAMSILPSVTCVSSPWTLFDQASFLIGQTRFQTVLFL